MYIRSLQSVHTSGACAPHFRRLCSTLQVPVLHTSGAGAPHFRCRCSTLQVPVIHISGACDPHLRCLCSTLQHPIDCEEMSLYKINYANGSSASVSIMGIPFGDFDRTGHWAIWCISKMFEAAQLQVLLNGFLDYKHIIDEDAALSIIKQQISLDSKLRSLSLKSPIKLKFDSEIKQLKKTSVVSVVKLKNENTDEILGENVIKLVRIGRKTRRSIPFPEWFHEKYSSFIGTPGHPGTEKEELPKIPQNAFEYITSPGYSDVDMNRHVNQSSYIQFCMDAATHASLNGYYDHYTKDMCLYPSLQWTITYVGESLANDELNIFTWQSENCPEQICFAMLVNGQKIIFHASTIFGKEADEPRFHHKL
ncbi:uncharacterized protein LOC125683521 [Ostrea edulis]|uniref:uncharacterized protein LOC125683521 n=1 Tax=Ostrea edulis TaxID=37623 RepID=UPI0024AF6E52|nr:uncharacterized protein LOC125683521 [Ostrea edulis]